MTNETIDQLKMQGYIPFFKYFTDNYLKLSENDWELHKQYVKEGVNPNEIAKMIQNDELEKLQEISSQENFNYNQIIEPSLYEKYSFINTKDVTLIDYAAFFGSIKCFRYLLMNGANINNVCKYAVAGGNLEIIHLCEQNNLSIESELDIAIKFYQNDIFMYIYENKNNKYTINELIDSLFKNNVFLNIKLFSFLIEQKRNANNFDKVAFSSEICL